MQVTTTRNRGIIRPSILYKLVRERLGVSQQVMAGILGITRRNYIYREHFKRMFSVEEISAIRYSSGLEWQEFGELMDEISKHQ